MTGPAAVGRGAPGHGPARAAGLLAGPSLTTRSVRTARHYVPAIVVFVGGIVLWEVVVGSLGLQKFVMPKPTQILTAMQENWTSDRFGLWPSFTATLWEALTGLGMGTAVGLAMAVATAHFAAARNILLPIAVAANAIPIIAFAPLVNTWFGLLNPASKAVMAAVLVFFPVYANVIRGLVQVDPGTVELMRSYAASDWTIFLKVRIPNALPYFFTAMKIATTLSLIGAIVGEYFGGSSLVLGRIILQGASALRFDVTWAAILLGAAAGIAMYLVVVVAERLVIPWHASMRREGQ